MQNISKNVDNLQGIIIRLHPNNYRHFLIEIEGAKGTPYEGGIFYMEMFLTKEYPMKPPRILFLTPIIHPNIFPEGTIFLPILKYKWTPALTIAKTVQTIQNVLEEIEPENYECIPDFYMKEEARQATLKYAVI